MPDEYPKFKRARHVPGERAVRPVPIRLIPCLESRLFVLCAESVPGVHEILAFPNELFCMN